MRTIRKPDSECSLAARVKFVQSHHRKDDVKKLFTTNEKHFKQEKEEGEESALKQNKTRKERINSESTGANSQATPSHTTNTNITILRSSGWDLIPR